MPTVAGFVLDYPEFASRGTEALNSALRACNARVSDTFSAAVRDEVVYLEMCVKLSTSTKGRNTRKEGTETTYEVRLRDLKANHALGRRLW